MENGDILRQIELLPEDLRREIYDFIEFLTNKWKKQKEPKLPFFIDTPIEVDKIIRLGRQHMPDKVFVDTNVWIYAVFKSSEEKHKHEMSSNLITTEST